MDEIPRNPRLELQMAIAGPLVSGIIGLVCMPSTLDSDNGRRQEPSSRSSFGPSA